MTVARHARSLPDLLLEQGSLSREQLQQAQAMAAKARQPLKRAIIQQGWVSEEALATLIAEQSGSPIIDLSTYLIKPEVIQLVPEALARKHTLIPVFQIGEAITVAIDDPMNFFALDEVRLKTSCEVKAVVATESSIRQAIDQAYGTSGTVAEVAKAIREAALPKKEEDAAAEAPIIKLVNLLIMQAMQEGASDIHLEPGDETCRTRFRIDGVLQEVKGPPPHLHPAIASRIKVLAKLDIAEKRKPQDGRFRLTMEGKEVDLRVSCIPTQFGEKVVMRLLDSASLLLSLPQLGLEEATRTQFDRLIHLPHGIILVTGPTGSGKTTTLYAALSLINDVTRNIITIEDPIEYHLPGVNQVQVNPKADVTFASALRAFLRQDPNVIMVGEIRDRETAEIAIQASLTGHLVLSTLHTNDAPSSLTRLIEMGVEPFLIASSVVGVLAQRLVRVICPKCKTACHLDAALARELHVVESAQLSRGKGCPTCRQTGYKGRLGIFELLLMTEPVRYAVGAKASAQAIRDAAGMRALRDDGMAKVHAGVTTVEEVLRVTQAE